MRKPAPFQFGISSLLLITTLVAIILSVSLMEPGVGIALAILSTPALVSTYGFVRRRRDEGRSVSDKEKVVLFLLFQGVAALTGLAAGAALLVASLATYLVSDSFSRFTGLALWTFIGFGIGISLILLIFLVRLDCRRLRKKPARIQEASALPSSRWARAANNP